MTSHDYQYNPLDELVRQAKRHGAGVMWRVSIASLPPSQAGYWTLSMPNGVQLTSTSVEGVLHQLRKLTEAA